MEALSNDELIRKYGRLQESTALYSRVRDSQEEQVKHLSDKRYASQEAHYAQEGVGLKFAELKRYQDELDRRGIKASTMEERESESPRLLGE